MVRKTKQDALETRNGLLDAAERVFCERGVSRASLGDIAAAAGATRGAIYWHFKDKVDLFNAMMDRVTLPLEHAFNAFDGRGDMEPVVRVRAALLYVFRVVSTDERTRRVFDVALNKVEYVADLWGVRDRHIAATDAFVNQLERDLRLAFECQGVHTSVSPRDAAVGLHCLFDGLLREWILKGGGFDLVRVGVVTLDAYLRGLGLRWAVSVGDVRLPDELPCDNARLS